MVKSKSLKKLKLICIQLGIYLNRSLATDTIKVTCIYESQLILNLGFAF